ncbi:MAG: hypothetical protein ACLQIB_23775, partial [Isosphaeraceae bacterium]
TVIIDWQLPNSALGANGSPWRPKWLVDRVGVDYFGHAVQVHITTFSLLAAPSLAARFPGVLRRPSIK